MEQIGNKKIMIIIGIIAIILAIILVVINKKNPLVYSIGRSFETSENVFIEDKKSLEKFIKKVKLENIISRNFKKITVTEFYNDEYFSDKKLAAVVVYEDTSKNYIYSIDDIIYNSDKTQATIKYTYKEDGYAGSLDSSWYTCMFAEIYGSVKKVDFQLDNSPKK